jgi:hypothetical protein
MTTQNPSKTGQAIRLANDLEMITTVDLRTLVTQDNPAKEVHQFVYASQLYGSLFALYSCIKPSEVVSTPTGCEVKNIDLNLFNYQGALNIGFTEEAPLCFKKDSIYYVIFGVRALSSLRSAPVTCNIPVSSATPTRVKFFRFLYRTLEFAGVDETTIDDFGTLKNPLPDASVFDSEFYSRSGADSFVNKPRPGLTNETLQQIKKDILDGKLEVNNNKRVASPRCTQSDVNLIYR